MKKTENIAIEDTINKETKPVSLMVSKADKLVLVKTDDDVVKATEFLVQVKSKIDSLEEERQSYTKPINESLRRLNARFKELTEPLKKAEKAVKEAILSYRAIREEERLKEQARLQKKNGNKDIALTDALPDIVESKSGESRTSKRWVFEIVDEKKIPREYLKVDEVKVTDAISKGERKIAGLKIFQKETLSIYK
jgi:hypothetical protein